MSITRRVRQTGLSLIELVVAIVIIGAAVAGVLGVFSITTKASADPMVQKQALAIAEAVLEEVQLQPFTYCDPDDANAATALSAAACSAGGAEAIGAESSAPYGPESRTSSTNPFDNVNDYNGFSMSGGISDIAGNAIPNLNGYSVAVSVAGQALGGISSTESLLINVTVKDPSNTTTVTLDGYRTRYAPNALP